MKISDCENKLTYEYEFFSPEICCAATKKGVGNQKGIANTNTGEKIFVFDCMKYVMMGMCVPLYIYMQVHARAHSGSTLHWPII